MTMTTNPARPPARRQRGLSLIGVLLFGAIAVLLVVFGARVMPSALEYFAIKRAVETVTSSGVSTPLEVQRSFDRQAAVDDITSISGRDLLVTRAEDGSLDVSFSYEKRIPLFGPATLLILYEGGKVPR